MSRQEFPQKPGSEYIKARRNAFGYALSGIAEAWRREAHLRIHGGAIALVILCGVHFNIARWEWLMVTLCCALVIILELVNTAIETLCDVVTTEQNDQIRYIKDISSSAVFLACVASLIVALVVFGPKFLA
jgi:diacylglycerol kinase (ATP)